MGTSTPFLAYSGESVQRPESRCRTRRVPPSSPLRCEEVERRLHFGARAAERGRHWIACHREGQIYIRSLTDPTLVRQVSTDGGHEP